MEKLIGKTQKSNYGQYEYEVKGILPKGEYVRPVRAVLIVKKEQTQKVIDLFELYGIRYRGFEIKLDIKDFEKSQFL